MSKIKNITLPFDIAKIRQSVGDYHLLTSAELRMQIIKTNMDSDQRVELYHGLGSSARYLVSRLIDNQSKGKWLSFDVTEPLRKWIEGNCKMKISQVFFFYLVL